MKQERFYRLFILLLIVGLGFVCTFKTDAMAEDTAGSVLLLPVVPGTDVDIEKTEKIDSILSKRMKKFIQVETFTIKDFKAEYGKKRARRLMRCGDRLKCIDKQLARADYDVVVVGKANHAGGRKIEVEFKVYNITESEVRRKKTFTLKKGIFRDKPHARKWTVGLLVPPEELFDTEEQQEEPEEVIEEEEEYTPPPKPRKKPRKRRSGLASPKKVKAGIKAAYMQFVAGNITAASKKIRKVTENRCACDADGKAFGMKAMLDAFGVAHKKAETALEKKDSKTVIGTLEEMKTLERELSDEGRRLGVTDESKYAKEMNDWFARGYIIQGQGYIRDSNYLEARESFRQALEIAPDLPEAKSQLAKMPKYARQLYMQGKYMVDYAPEEAKKKLKMVLELVDEDDELHEKVLETLEEIEDM